MQVISHAGCDGQYTQNTVSALRQSAPHVDMIEVDIRVCGSGEVVLFHDETLERAADDPRKLRELSWSELRDVRIFETNEPIPRLQDALDAIPSTVGFNLEFKEAGIASIVKKITAEYDHRLLISSFQAEAIRDVNRLSWDVKTGYIFENVEEVDFRSASELDCDFVHPHYECCFESEIIDVAHKSGMGVNVWTVSDKSTLQALRSLDVDGVIVDRWDIFESVDS